ncbi:unnamed protein product [Prorocentrum cordatum]|uniref:Uncharacterized protein n=1 Tax=Prorocentrum cordatum TaxID=2364126 RepID=A0ABN9UMT0_9DINO|nr:unnamed protein product [Polarella glacialis]
MPPATKLLPPRGSSRPLPPRVVAPHHTAPAQSTVRGDLPSTARKAVTCDSCHPEEEKEEEEEDEESLERGARGVQKCYGAGIPNNETMQDVLCAGRDT